MQKIKVLINYFKILVCAFSFISCSSSTKNYENFKQQNTKKLLVLYASDDPLWLPYFSTAFTRRMQNDGFYDSFENPDLNKEWLLNSIGHLKDIHVEEKLTQFGTKLRDVFLSGKYAKAYKLSNQYMQEAIYLLANQPASVSYSYAILCFWASVANLKYSKSNAIKYGIIYEKYLPLNLKDALESEVHDNLIDQLKDLTKIYIAKQTIVHITNIRNCNVYVNGQELKTSKVLLPPKMYSVVTASCANGLFSQAITAEKYKTVKIMPYYPASFFKMPPLSTLPKELLANFKLSSVLLIFWSHGGKYLEVKLVDPKVFFVVAKTHIDLSSKKNVDEAGDLLISFLKTNSTFISKK